MTYAVGIDLGTTFTAAAISDGSDTQMVALAHDRVSIPSVVAPVEGRSLVGDEAASVSATSPWNVGREFKRRFGDPTPMYIAGNPYAPDHFMGELLQWVVRRVEELQGHPAEHIVVTHPASWQRFKLDLLRASAAARALPNIRFLSEPAAAAVHYHSRQRVPVGSAVAVYDLGGGTFDVTLLERSTDGFTLRATGGLEHAGGLDLDDAVFHLVSEALSTHFSELDAEDLEVQRAVARIREECTRAKIGLSYDARAIVPVVLPGLVTEVLVRRSEFEDLVRPLIGETIIATSAAIDKAGLDSHPDSVLLVGGSSRVPIVSELLTRALGLSVAVDAHPKHAVALGAAASAFAGLDTGSREPTSRSHHDTRQVEVQELPGSTVRIPSDATASARPNQRFLVYLTGSRGGHIIDLPSGSTILGRNDGNEVHGLESRLVSRRHLEVDRDGTTVTIRDLGSTNGTSVDGNAVGQSPLAIEPGTIIDVAGTLMMLDGPGARMEPVSAIVDSWAMPAIPEMGFMRRRQRAVAEEWLDQLEQHRGSLEGAADRLRRARRFERPSSATLGLWRDHMPRRLADLSIPTGSVVLGWATLPSLLRLDLPDFISGPERKRALGIIGHLLDDPTVPLTVPLIGETTVIQQRGPQASAIARSLLASLKSTSPSLAVEVSLDHDGDVAQIQVGGTAPTGQSASGLAASGLVLFGVGPGALSRASSVVSIAEERSVYQTTKSKVVFAPATLADDPGPDLA